MAGISCASCKFLSRHPLNGNSGCSHPNAIRHDRVRGNVVTWTYDAWEKTYNNELLDRCDSEGWFKENRIRWWEVY